MLKVEMSTAKDRNVYSSDLYDNIKSENIIIRHQPDDVMLSGIIYTRDIANNLPYYMIIYDRKGETSSNHMVKWIAKNASKEFMELEFVELIEAVKKLEKIFADVSALDIEFTIKKSYVVEIVRVSPLKDMENHPPIISDKEFYDIKALAKCAYLDRFHILSDMAFWRPADVIGTNPRPLDYSIYREILTNDIWSKGISKLGYQYVSDPLMEKVGNKPYISVYNTFAGLMPANMPQQFNYRLSNFYEEKLKAEKKNHNKIESEIMFSTYDFSTKRRIEELYEYDFSDDEIMIFTKQLKKITTNAVNNYEKIVKADKESLDKLTDIRHEIRANAPLTEKNIMKLYRYIFSLLDSIKRFGTETYVRQMRCAFMAKSFCKSLVSEGYMDVEQMNEYIHSITTISSEYARDLLKYKHGEMSKEDFNSIYGHLRHRTYDIRTDCYKKINIEDEEIDESEFEDRADDAKRPELKLDRDILEKAISESGLEIDADTLSLFISETIKNKELFKFEFTKSLSLMLDIIIRIGDILMIAREDMSYLEIQEMLGYHSRNSYIDIIEDRRNMYHSFSNLILPNIIFSVGDIDVIDLVDGDR